MKTLKFEVSIELPEGAAPHQSPENQAGIIREIVQHRAWHLVGNGGGKVDCRPMVDYFEGVDLLRLSDEAVDEEARKRLGARIKQGIEDAIAREEAA